MSTEEEEGMCHNLLSTDQKNEVSKMFIVSLGNWNELESTPQSQGVRTLKYLLNQLIIAHLILERYDEFQYIFFFI